MAVLVVIGAALIAARADKADCGARLAPLEGITANDGESPYCGSDAFARPPTLVRGSRANREYPRIGIEKWDEQVFRNGERLFP